MTENCETDIDNHLQLEMQRWKGQIENLMMNDGFSVVMDTDTDQNNMYT